MSSDRLYVNVGGPGKNLLVAYFLWFFLGGFGIHRFYLGRVASGITQLALLVVGIVTSIFIIGVLPLIALGIWWILDAYFVYKYVNESNERIEAKNNGNMLFSATRMRDDDELDRLEKLHTLYQKGVFSEDEYSSRRADILKATQGGSVTSAGRKEPW